MKSTKFQRVFQCYHYLTTIRKQDVEDKINIAAQVQTSSPVKCFPSQTLESWKNAPSVPQRSWRDLIWSSFLTVAQIATLPAMPLNGCRSRAVAENICTSGCTLGMFEREKNIEEVKREPMEEAFWRSPDWIKLMPRWDRHLSGSFIYMLLAIYVIAFPKLLLVLSWTWIERIL